MRISLSSLTAALHHPDSATPSWRPAAGVALRILVMLGTLLLCWQLAGVFAQTLSWQTSPPALTLAAEPATDNGAARAALTRWFASAESGVKPAGSTDGLELIAVIAGKDGVALIGGASASGPAAFPVGKEVRPGLRLTEVLRDKVIFEQGGNHPELAFPSKPGSAPIMQPGAPTPATTGNAPPAAASAPVQNVSISRGDLMGIAQQGNLGDWDKGLANFVSGGVRVTDADKQPLAKVLNLQNGDVIKGINDRDISQLADVSLIYHYFSQSQDVNINILRDGKPQQLHFEIEP